MGDIIIGGTLHSAAVGNTVARTDEILDSTQNKKQNVVNAETAQHLTNIDEMNIVKLFMDCLDEGIE